MRVVIDLLLPKGRGIEKDTVSCFVASRLYHLCLARVCYPRPVLWICNGPFSVVTVRIEGRVLHVWS